MHAIEVRVNSLRVLEVLDEFLEVELVLKEGVDELAPDDHLAEIFDLDFLVGVVQQVDQMGLFLSWEVPERLDVLNIELLSK